MSEAGTSERAMSEGAWIHGIQQVGIGVPDLESAWRWYRKYFGFDVPVFQEAAEAPYMTRYTGGEVRFRDAVLALNMAGGGGFEVWQYVGRKTQPPEFQPQLGDYGILATRVKSPDVDAAWHRFTESGLLVLGDALSDPGGNTSFFLTDPLGLLFQVVPEERWFSKPKAPTGGVDGVLIGVSDIERALPLYRDLLGFGDVLYDQEGSFDDLRVLPGGDAHVRRVLLERRGAATGAFGKLLGRNRIELVQRLDGYQGRHVFEGRDWGDLGFIHLCFDVNGMVALKQRCDESGFGFTVDSGESFDMGEAAGRFSYVEDPDGTLIEFVETHKVPVLKRLGWYLNLRKRDPGRPLPDWMVRLLGLGRVKAE